MSRNSDAKGPRKSARQFAIRAAYPRATAGAARSGPHRGGVTFEDWITERGWTFDLDFSAKGLASWYYEPSAAESDDEAHEVVTRVWFTVGENREQDFPNRVNARCSWAAAARMVMSPVPSTPSPRIS